MAATKITADVDLLLSLGKILNKKSLSEWIARELRSLQIGDIKINPNITLDTASIDDVMKEMSSLGRQLAKQADDLNRSLSEGTKGTAKYHDDTQKLGDIRKLQQEVNLMERLMKYQIRTATQGKVGFLRQNTKKQKRDFERVRIASEAIVAGTYTDRRGNQHKVTLQNLKELQGITDELGQPIFPPGVLNNVKAYSNYLADVVKMLEQIKREQLAIGKGPSPEQSGEGIRKGGVIDTELSEMIEKGKKGQQVLARAIDPQLDERARRKESLREERRYLNEFRRMRQRHKELIAEGRWDEAKVLRKEGFESLRVLQANLRKQESEVKASTRRRREAYKLLALRTDPETGREAARIYRDRGQPALDLFRTQQMATKRQDKGYAEQTRLQLQATRAGDLIGAETLHYDGVEAYKLHVTNERLKTKASKEEAAKRKAIAKQEAEDRAKALERANTRQLAELRKTGSLIGLGKKAPEKLPGLISASKEELALLKAKLKLNQEMVKLGQVKKDQAKGLIAPLEKLILKRTKELNTLVALNRQATKALAVEKARAAEQGKLVKETAPLRGVSDTSFLRGHAAYQTARQSIHAVPESRLQDTINFLNRSLADQRAKLMALDPAAKNYSGRVDHLNNRISTMSKSLTEANKRMGGFGTAVQQAGALMRQFFRYAIGYGALYQALAAVRALIGGIVDLETALKGIQAVTASSAAQMRKIEVAIKGIALSTQFNTTEIAKGAQILGQAGVIPKELPSALRATAQFASATGTALELSADLVTSMRNVFTNLSDETIANQLTKAINISKLTAADLKTVVSLSSQIAKKYELTSEQYFAAVTTLRNAGIKPSTIATGLRQGLIEIFSPDSKTLQALKTRYEQIGEALSGSEIRDKFFAFSLTKSPLVAALRELERLGFTGEGKKVFQRAYDVRAENAISALINNLNDLEAASSRLTFGSAAVTASLTQMEALSHSLKNLGAAISVFASEMGGPALNGLEKFVDGITDSIQKVTELHQRLKALTGTGIGLPLATGTVAGTAAFFGSKGGVVRQTATAIGAAAGTGYLTTKAQEAAAATGGPGQFAAEDMVEAVITGAKDLIITALLLQVPGLIFRGLGLSSKTTRARVLADSQSSAVGGFLKGKGKKSRGAPGTQGDLFERPSTLSDVYSEGVGPALTALTVLLGHKIWGYIVAATRPLIKVLNLLPFGKYVAAIGAIVGLAYSAVRFFGNRSFSDTKKRYESAVKAAEVANNKFQAALKDQAEFKLSDLPGKGTYKAEAGTTAAEIESIGEDLEAYSRSIRAVFGDVTRAQTDRLFSQLLDLARKAPQAGTATEDTAFKEFEQALEEIDISVDVEGFYKVKGQIRAAANAASGFTDKAEAIRGDILGFVQSLMDQEDALKPVQEAYLAAYNKVTRGNSEFRRMMAGIRVGSPLELVLLMQDFQQQVLEEQNAIYEGSEAFKELTAGKVSADKLRFDETIRRMSALKDDNAIQAVLTEYFSSIEGTEEAVLAFLRGQIDLLDVAAGYASPDRQKLQKMQMLHESMARNKPSGPYDSVFSRLESFTGVGIGDQVDQVRRRTYDRDSSVFEAMGGVPAMEQLAALVAAQEDASKAFVIEAGKIADNLGEKGEQDVSDARTTLITLKETYGPGAPKGPETQALAEAAKTLAIAPELFNFITTLDDKKIEELTGPERRGPEGQYNPPTLLKEAGELGKQISESVAERELKSDKEGPNTYAQQQKLLLIDDQIARAKQRKDFAELGKAGDDNLYIQKREAELQKLYLERLHLEKQRVQGATEGYANDKEKAKIAKELTENKLASEKAALDAQQAIDKARLDQATAHERQLKTLNGLKIRGLQRELAIALTNGNIEEIFRVDREILALKKAIRDAIIARMVAEKKTPEEIEDFKQKDQGNQESVLQLDASTRKILQSSEERLAEVPVEPYLDKDPAKAGRKKARGYQPTIGQEFAQRTARADVADQEVARLQDYYDRTTSTPHVDFKFLESSKQAATLRQEIRDLREEAALLREEAKGLGPEAVPQQLSKGLDAQAIGSRMMNLKSSMKNLGTTLQDDVVSGLDNVGDALANALVKGENAADALRTAFANMLQQMAIDLLKSAIMSGLTKLIMLMGGGGVVSSAPVKVAEGGVVESKSTGGTLRHATRTLLQSFAPAERRADGGSIGAGKMVGRGAIVSGGSRQKVSVTEGQGVLTARVTKVLGPQFIDALNNPKAAMSNAASKSLEFLGIRKKIKFSPVAGGPDEPGGIVRGPGTGTSDSVAGVIVDAAGRPKRGLRLSDKEGILTSRAVRDLGPRTVDRLNKASKTVLTKVRTIIEGAAEYRKGGITTLPGTHIAQAAMTGFTLPPLARASGGMLSEASSVTGGSATAQAEGQTHTFNTSLTLTADEKTDIDIGTLRSLDQGINLRVKEYVDEQLRPGGLLERARGGRR